MQNLEVLADNLVKAVGIFAACYIAIMSILSPIVGGITSALVAKGVIAADCKWAKTVSVLCSMTFHAKSSILVLAIACAAGGCLAWTVTGCSSSKPTPAQPEQVADGARLACLVAVQVAPKSEQLAKQYGLTVDEFALQVCGFVGATAGAIGSAVALPTAGAPSQ